MDGGFSCSSQDFNYENCYKKNQIQAIHMMHTSHHTGNTAARGKKLRNIELFLSSSFIYFPRSEIKSELKLFY